MSALSHASATHSDQFGQPLDETTQSGLALYETKLKNLLEPAHSGEVVAIHIDTGDYLVAANSPVAMRAMRQLHPTGLLFLYTIGPAEDQGMGLRMSGQLTGAQRK